MELLHGTLVYIMATAPLLAQANESSNWVAPVVLVAVLLFVIFIAVASRQSDEAERPRPKAPDEPVVSDVEGAPTKDVDAMREKYGDDIAAILDKPSEERTLAEVRKLNVAKKADPELRKMLTSEAQTEQAVEEHKDMEVEPAEEAEEPSQEVKEVAEEAAEEIEEQEAAAGEEEAEEVDAQEDKEAEAATEEPASDADAEAAEAAAEEIEEPEEELKTVAEGLEKTRGGFSEKFHGLFKGKEEISDGLRDEIEAFLYTSDIGTKAVTKIINAIDNKLRDDVKRDPEQVWEYVRARLTEMLKAREEKLDVSKTKPFVILVVGVNGAGKTTTIGKMASKYRRQGKSVMMVAGDTFRAAAVEQLEVWAKRVDVPFHRGEPEADPASVVYDGIERGLEEDIDVVICDTSGRLHTNDNLMDELKKIRRVSDKALEGAPHEVMLVLDANSGQNAVQQAKTFGAALDVTGLAVTKLDGTARGGVILGIGEELDVPVRYIGIGEGIKDLRDYDGDEFAEALFL